MLNRTWRISLLVVAFILVLYPTLFQYSNWVAAIAVLVLLFGEFGDKSCCGKTSAPTKKAKKGKRK